MEQSKRAANQAIHRQTVLVCSPVVVGVARNQVVGLLYNLSNGSGSMNSLANNHTDQPVESKSRTREQRHYQIAIANECCDVDD